MINILLFTEVCIVSKKKIIVFGHSWKEKIKTIKFVSNSNSFNTDITFCRHRSDFFLTIDCNHKILENQLFNIYVNEKLEFENIQLRFPFEKCNISLHPDKSLIISTMCKDYDHRLDEWISYNKKIGVSGIIIFNNNDNDKNNINEFNNKNASSLCKSTLSLDELKMKYNDYITVVNFPYSSLCNANWNNIQRNALHIGVNAYLKKCRNIALIDADEFIYSHKYPDKSIESILSGYNKSIIIESNIITNKSLTDTVDNNILEICKYMGGSKYTKVILKTSLIKENEFIITPHNHGTCMKIDSKILHHYHAWVNSRCGWNKNMKEIDFLYNL